MEWASRRGQLGRGLVGGANGGGGGGGEWVVGGYFEAWYEPQLTLSLLWCDLHTCAGEC